MVTIKLSNKVFYILIIVSALLLIGAGVYAYNSGNPDTLGTPSVMGHTLSEISPPYYCANNGGFLKFTGSAWTCVNPLPTVTCTGTNKGLQWTGSAWSCVTFSCPACDSCCPVECYWEGWDDPCGANYCEYEVAAPSSCMNDPGTFTAIKKYCSGGQITNSKLMICCPSHGGQCLPFL